MYVLTKLEQRAETTDTLIYFVAENRGSLEEIMLSLYNEIMEAKNNYSNIPDNIFIQRVYKYMNQFSIIEVPYLKN